METASATAQVRGTVTLPQKVRERLGITKGTEVKFLMLDDGRIEIQAVPKEKVTAALAVFDQIGAILKEEGVTLEQWMSEGKKVRKKLLKKMYPNIAP